MKNLFPKSLIGTIIQDGGIRERRDGFSSLSPSVCDFLNIIIKKYSFSFLDSVLECLSIL